MAITLADEWMHTQLHLSITCLQLIVKVLSYLIVKLGVLSLKYALK